MSVFVVDDDADARRFVIWLLTAKTRHQVVGFPTAEAALDELRRMPPSVLVTDLRLPGLSGEDLAREASRLAIPPRIVLMSGDAGRLERARSLSRNLLRKPFSIAELLLQFEQLMEES